MPEPLTITIKEAAERLGAPRAVVQRVAADLGLLIQFGSRKRIDPNDLPEIMDACRSTPKGRASIGARTRVSTLSATPGAESVQQAHEIAERLKGRSPATLPPATGRTARLHRIR